MLSEQRIFPNGLKLIVNQSDSLLSCILIRIETGVANEKKKFEGITSVIESLLLCGTTAYPSKNSLLSAINSFGGEVKAVAELDSIKIYITCLKDHVEKAIGILSQIVFNSLMNDNDLNDIKKTIHSYRTAQEETPFLLAYDDLREVMFDGSGLDKNILGRKGSVENLKAENVKKYWKDIICPANFIISITGNVDIENIYDVVMEQFYGKFMQFNGKETKEIAHVNNNSLTRYVLNTKKLNQDRILIGYLTNGFCSDNYYATYLAKQILDCKISEEFSKNNLIYSPGCFLNSFKNNGLFYLRFACETENASVLIKKMADVFLKLSLNGISNAEFVSQKQIFKTGFVKLFENPLEWCRMTSKYARYYDYNFDFDYELKKIDNVTQGDCMQVLRALAKSMPYVSVVGNSKLSEQLYFDYYDKFKK